MNKRIEALMRDFRAMEIQDTRGYGDLHTGVMFTKDDFEKFVYAIIDDLCDIAREWETRYVIEDNAAFYVDDYIKRELENV